VPKLNSNDNSYILVEWLVDQGQVVSDGDPIVVLETSKAAQEITSPRSGAVRQIAAIGAECEPGQVIGEITDATEGNGKAVYVDEVVDNSPAASRKSSVIAVGKDPGPVLTKPARELARRYGVTQEELNELGKRVISRQDVEQLRTAEPGAAGVSRDLTDPAATGTLYTISRTQHHVAQRVREAHQSIPSAFAMVKVQAGELIKYTERIARQQRIFVGIPEFVLKATGMLREEFPVFFSRPYKPAPLEQLVLAPSSDIGLTIDVGTGLYVPVIKHVDRLSVREIAQEFMQARTGAVRGVVGPQHRSPPAMIFSVSNQDDVVMSMPMIFPATVATLVIGGLQNEVWIGADDKLGTRKYAYLGMAYDHRYINGRDCIMFLRRMKELLEAPENIESAKG
jgi:2-oxoglutarate dehydrogenase E2 component (dihydrolipoamide succinyltransferase)